MSKGINEVINSSQPLDTQNIKAKPKALLNKKEAESRNAAIEQSAATSVKSMFIGIINIVWMILHIKCGIFLQLWNYFHTLQTGTKHGKHLYIYNLSHTKVVWHGFPIY